MVTLGQGQARLGCCASLRHTNSTDSVAWSCFGVWLGRQPGATAPEEIAPLYWELHTQHDQVEKVFFPSDQTRSE